MTTPPALPGITGIHHVALAVPDLDAALQLWTGVLGAHLELRAVVADQGVEAAALEWPGAPTQLELVAPHGAQSGVQRFLERRGAGLHHVAWEVTDVAAALDAARARGLRLIDERARPGLHGTPVAFVHPASTGGVLLELVQAAATAA